MAAAAYLLRRAEAAGDSVNVLLVCPVYAPHAGGGGQYFPLLVEELLRRPEIGRMVVLTEAHPDRPRVADEAGAIIWRVLPQRDTRTGKSAWYSAASFVWTYVLLAILVPALVLWYRADILHVTRYLRRPFYLLLAAVRRGLRVRVVLDLRATVPDPAVLSRMFGIDAVICNSDAVFAQVRSARVRPYATLVENPMRFPTALSAADLDRAVAGVHRAIRSPFLVCVGQLLERKSFFELLEAFERFQRHHPGYQLVFAGRNMIGAAAEVALARVPAALFVGEVTHAQATALMQAADAVLQPSKIEGIPRVSLEALSLGRKVLLPPCVPEFRDAGDAFTIPAATVEAIEQGLARVVATAERPQYDLARHEPSRSIAKVIAVYSGGDRRTAAAAAAREHA